MSCKQLANFQFFKSKFDDSLSCFSCIPLFSTFFTEMKPYFINIFNLIFLSQPTNSYKLKYIRFLIIIVIFLFIFRFWFCKHGPILNIILILRIDFFDKSFSNLIRSSFSSGIKKFCYFLISSKFFGKMIII